ncbi:ABC transporter permease [Arcanobacterium pinnipediorum]|uniref:ABC transporter permease n=1 Tax=Arcanobacterium pinnipediorum TaxID=1503041 RepID=A0ABY5AH13_9ACTO|nr:ABC transporter permease [Arcanobacterium pinnipediorum]USR79213.1 ABC transporter permease [Arcanobacterium pinnipediorum]
MLALIMKREMKALLATRSNQIGFAFTIIFILAVGIVSSFFTGSDEESDSGKPETSYVVGIERTASSAAGFIEASQPYLTTEIIDDGHGQAWLTDAVENHADSDDDVDYAVVAGTAENPVVIFPNVGAVDSSLGEALQFGVTMWIAGDGSNLSADVAHNAITAAQAADVQILDLKAGDSLLSSNPAGYFAAIATLFLLVMVTATGLSTISMGVVEEKSSQVVEIILSSVKPRTLLLGKILGIGTVILGQFALYIVAMIVSLKISGFVAPFSFTSIISWTLVWAVIGFFSFSIIAGALAATVSRQEDLAPVTGTLMMLIFIPVYAGMFLVTSLPDALVTKILSYLPFFSAFIMPVREAYGISSLTEQIIALVIAVAFIPLMAALAGKIYRNSVLHSGKRLSISKALKAK